MTRTTLVLFALCWIFTGCTTVADPPRIVSDATEESAPTEGWQCRNDLEVRCGEGKCTAETEGAFTPMSVHADNSGTLSVCAYSGCWEGTGKVVSNQEFLILIGLDLMFSTAQESEAGQDVVLAIDREDQVAILKAGDFAHPLLCESTPPSH